MTNGEEEKPVDFYSERDILGQPLEVKEVFRAAPVRPTYKSNLEAAPLMNRFLAGIIDFFRVSLLLHFIVDVWLYPNLELQNRGAIDFVNIFTYCLYHGIFDSSEWQGTLGKRWLGIKISNSKGGRISFINAIGRYLASLISVIVILLGYINVFLNTEHRAWHDILSGTYVIRDKTIDDVIYIKKRKNGYAIAIILAVITTMIYINMYTMEADKRNLRADIYQSTH